MALAEASRVPREAPWEPTAWRWPAGTKWNIGSGERSLSRRRRSARPGTFHGTALASQGRSEELMSVIASIVPSGSRSLTLALFVAGTMSLTWKTARADQASSPPRACADEYADNFAALDWQARELDRRPEATFSYCARTAATYECLSYAQDGAVRRERHKVVLHGTAFAYRRQGDQTLLLTNEHVASWPAVTDRDHVVSGVPAGCRKVGEALTLVDDPNDGYARDDIAVTRVVVDRQLDVAVLQAKSKLQIMPWRIGRSGALREHNAVEVRGFPFGAIRTTNSGMVISAHDHDGYRGWNHDDFVVDALLSSGNAGAPVLAVSCVTGQYELVGIYHSGYATGSAVNVVVGIDQVRDLMTTLKRASRGKPVAAPALDASARRALGEALDAEGDLFFPFGTQVAAARRAATTGHVFVVYGKDFPAAPEPVLVFEDLWPEDGLKRVSRFWLGTRRGLKSCDPSSLAGEQAEELEELARLLRADAVAHARYRALQRVELGSRESARELASRREALVRSSAARRTALRGLAALAARLGPGPGERGAAFAEVVPFAPRVDGQAATTPVVEAPTRASR
jgi:serine protease Do